MRPTFVWLRVEDDEWVTETFSADTRIEAGIACSDRVIELGLQGVGLVIEPELMLRGGGHL